MTVIAMASTAAASFLSLNPALPCPPRPARAAVAARAQPTSNKWWAPLFVWPSPGGEEDERRKWSYEALTEEKAKQLRLRMMEEAESFHDAMYHSGIASRLASRRPSSAPAPPRSGCN